MGDERSVQTDGEEADAGSEAQAAKWPTHSHTQEAKGRRKTLIGDSNF